MWVERGETVSQEVALPAFPLKLNSFFWLRIGTGDGLLPPVAILSHSTFIYLQ
jgi:hypothetical protein